MKLLRYFLSIPKTQFLNAHYFGFKGLFHFRIWVAWNTKLKKLGKRGSITMQPGSCLKFGMSDGTVRAEGRPIFSQDKQSQLCVQGRLAFSQGAQLLIGKGGVLSFGPGEQGFNSNTLIICSGTMKFGQDIRVGWGCTFLDSDGHSVDGHEAKGFVTVGDHVWIANGVTILKGTTIGNGCAIGAKALLSHSLFPDGSLIGSTKAGIIRQNIDWKV